MKMNITIGRDSRDKVNLEVKDQLSKITFLKIEMSLEDYAKAITGLSAIEVDGSVKGLEYVGKQKIMEPRSVRVSRIYSDKEKAVEYLINNRQEDGWILDTYLGSQGSIEWIPESDDCIINYAVYKYI